MRQYVGSETLEIVRGVLVAKNKVRTRVRTPRDRSIPLAGVDIHPLSDRPEIRPAGSRLGKPLGLAKAGQKDGDQQRDNRDDHEEFDERERGSDLCIFINIPQQGKR